MSRNSGLVRKNGVLMKDGKVFVIATDFSKDPGLTVQASRDEVDINKIVARIEKGLSVPLSVSEGEFLDVSDFSGLQDAIIKVQEAVELFMSYPASVREKFDNDPVKMVEFLENPANLDEAVSLGLVDRKPSVGPVPTEAAVPAEAAVPEQPPKV